MTRFQDLLRDSRIFPAHPNEARREVAGTVRFQPPGLVELLSRLENSAFLETTRARLYAEMEADLRVRHRRETGIA
jgi:hypothetical protein